MTKVERFEAFIATRTEKSDWLDYVNLDRTMLIRKMVLEVCGFPRSTLYQHAAIKNRLLEVECSLRKRGILQVQCEGTANERFERDSLAEADILEERINGLKKRLANLRRLVEEFGKQANKYAES